MSGLYQSRKMEARLSARLELPWVLSLNAELVETHHPSVVGQRYHRFSAPLRPASLAAAWMRGEGKEQYLVWKEGAGHGRCALNLEALGAEHAYEHGKGAAVGISHAGSESGQACI